MGIETPPPFERNPIAPLRLDLLESIAVNRSAVERRVAALPKRRTVKKRWQAAWLLKAITLIDLTTLGGDDSPSNVRRLCAKAKAPVRQELLTALGAGELPIRTAAVCVYHNMVHIAVKALEGSGIPVAAVSTGFPAGLVPLSDRLAQIRASVEDGAKEIDIVINRHLALRHEWTQLYDEIAACRQACGDAHMKTILATGELGNHRNVAKASWVAMMAGSDFIKTSTGKESVNATMAIGLTMTRAARDYEALTGHPIGFKPAGGIRTAKQSLAWLSMIKEEAGDRALWPDLFRFGASSLLGDIERQLEHQVTGRYSAAHRHAMA